MAMEYIADKAKTTAKKAGKRAGEKLIRKIGGDQTRDRMFDDLQFSFDQQVGQAEKLKKEIHRYETLVKEVRRSMKSVNDILADFFEEFWPRTKDFQMCLQDQETLWNDLVRNVHKMNDPIRRYQIQFEDIKERVQKRENKLMDFDIARRALEMAYNKDKVTGDKLTKLEDDFDDAEKEYQYINEDLLRDLPPILESRGGFVIEAFSNFFTSHEIFSSETFKVQGMLKEVIEGLRGQRLEVSIGRERKGRQRGSGPTRSGQCGERKGRGKRNRDTAPAGQAVQHGTHEQGMKMKYNDRPGPSAGMPGMNEMQMQGAVPAFGNGTAHVPI